jgi:hypothetical protein
VNGRSLILAAALLIGCAREVAEAPLGDTRALAPQPAAGGANVYEDFPVAAAKVPFVAADGARGFVVSFIEGDAFRFVTFRQNQWSEPRTIARDANLLVNRADSPSIAVNGETMIASWSTRNAHGSVVHIARSEDRGATWSAPQTPHPAGVSPYGFVSLTPDGDAVWLDGRALPGGMEGAGDMQLRATNDALLDSRVCDCCQTAIAMTSAGPIVAYRDRTAGEIRDIAIVRKTASGWSEPKTLHADGWKIEGCPVNGPQIDANGMRVVVAWFTAANDDPRVNVAFSFDGGATFSAPIRVSRAKAMGHVDVALRSDGSAVLTWLSQTAGRSILAARRVDADGTLHDGFDLGEASGFPRMAVSKHNVGVTWSRGERVGFAIIR